MNRMVKYTLLFFAFVAIIGIGLALTGDSEARLCVWDGESTSALASNATNWDSDLAPVAGDNILFDGLNATGDDACTWDLATNSFGTFTIGSGYSGTITQSSDMHITGFSQAGGTFTGVTTKWVYLSGNFTKTGGTFSIEKTSFNFCDETYLSTDSIIQTYNVIIDGKLEILSTSFYGIFFNRILTINNGAEFVVNTVASWNYGVSLNNYGLISGSGVFEIRLYDQNENLNLGNCDVSLLFYLYPSSVAGRNAVLTSDLINLKTITIYSGHATYTVTLDLNGHSLTASSITIGTRGILSNSAATDSVITCGSFTSTSGTFNHAGIILKMNDGGTITATEGEQFETVWLNGTVDIVNSINVTEDMMFINVPPEYDDIDVYLDGVYNSTIPSPYTLGSGIQIGAEYSYLPDIEITISQFYEDLDFSIYAYISTNLPVTYNITGTASTFLSYHEGRIVGMPPDIGNYTYTITATHESGSIDIVNGYILVGSLSTAEYSYDQIWGLILWIVITAFMLIGLLLNIPLIQIVAFMGTIGSIVASLRIPEFEVFLMIFALGNSALFFIGMVRYKR